MFLLKVEKKPKTMLPTANTYLKILLEKWHFFYLLGKKSSSWGKEANECTPHSISLNYSANRSLQRERFSYPPELDTQHERNEKSNAAFQRIYQTDKDAKGRCPFSSPSHTFGSPKYAKNLDCLLTLQCNCCHISDALQYLTNTPNSNQVDVISLRNAAKTLFA